VVSVTPVRVAIVEDHPVYRDGLTAAFGEASSDIEVVGAVGTVADTLGLLSGEAIDVLLLDLGLPDGSGLDLLATLRARHSRVAVVVLTMNEDRQMVLDAVRAGARGYLLKGAGRAEIVDAVRRAAAGGAVFHAGPADVVLAAALGALDDPVVALGLTPREAQVLRLLADGLSNQAIAARLGLAPKTVRNQVSTILTKLAVDTRLEAAARARAAGL
jgi:DNA-binding NarL/FixJ family response regulator